MNHDVKFMLNNLDLKADQRKFLSNPGGDVCEIDDDFADALRDLCNDKLVAAGFEEDYSLNDLGRRLQDLVDILFTG